MLGRSTGVKERAESGRVLAVKLAQDRKFRKQLLAAISHSAAAKTRARKKTGPMATAKRLAADTRLRFELREAAASLQKALTRVEKKRSHKVRNTFIAVGAGAAIAAGAWAARAKSSSSLPEAAPAGPEPI